MQTSYEETELCGFFTGFFDEVPEVFSEYSKADFSKEDRSLS